MDSPKSDKTAIAASPSGSSPPVQDSPFFSYLSDLSPIKPVKAAPVAQGLLELGSPPLVFTSPPTNAHREASFLKRHRLPQPSSVESKKTDASSIVSEKLIASLSSGLAVVSHKDSDIKNAEQPCGSPTCVDEYLADQLELATAGTVHSDNSCLKQPNNLPQSSKDRYIESKKIISKFSMENEEKSTESQINVSLALAENAGEEVSGKSIPDVESVKTRGKQTDAEKPNAILENVKSSFSLEHASKQRQCGQHAVQFVQTQNDCDQDIGSISFGPVGDTMLPDSKVSHRGMPRRCLQFEDAQSNCIKNSTVFWNLSDTIATSSSPATPMDLEVEDLADADLSTTSTNKGLVSLSRHVVKMFSSKKSEKSCFGVSKPSGFGLHLNSFAKALPKGCSATASIKLVEENYLNVQRLQSESQTNHPLLENKRCSTISLDIHERSSGGNEDGRHDTKYSRVPCSEASQYLQNVTFLINSPKQVEHSESPHSKRKTSSEHADNFEEFNQIKPPQKRKKSSSADDDAGCKHCNCKRTRCLKLYCDCFAAGIYCAESCACQGCFNKTEYEETVLEARQQVESRNPLAFAPKIVERKVSINNRDDGNRSTPSAGRHKRGCNCKKSKCLKKYCECYQAKVGCSSGCRCEGCTNVYGKKEDYTMSNQTVSTSDRRLEVSCDEKLTMTATQNKNLNTESCDPQNLTHMRSMFHFSDHRKDGLKLFLPGRYHLSPESDVTILSSYENSGTYSKNSDTFPIEKGKTLDAVPCAEDPKDGNTVVQTIPRSGMTNMCDLAPLPKGPSVTMASSSSSAKTREWKMLSESSQLCAGSVRPLSSGSLRWRSSPVTPMSRLGAAELQGLESKSTPCDILEDDMPEILRDTSTLDKAVKVSSPNNKRVSPPHNHLHEHGSSSSAGLRNGRKFILQAIPSFPPLTPSINSESSKNNQDCK